MIRLARMRLDNNDLARFLTSQREKMDVTQYYVGKNIGSTARQISAYEIGTARPKVETLIKLLDFFGYELLIVKKEMLERGR